MSNEAQRPRFLQDVVIPPGAFRLTLAAAVVLSHLSRFDIGRLAVLLFFYLSGYWTTRVWNAKFGPSSTTRFYAARYLRIAPLYLLVMMAAAQMRNIPIRLENVLLFGTASTRHDPIGVSWSLDIELQFYLMLPAFAIIAARKMNLTIAIIATISTVIGITLDSQFGIMTALKYLPAFLLGVITYTCAWKPEVRTACLSFGAFVVMTIITGFTPFLDKNIPDPFDEDIWSFFWMLPLLPYVAYSLSKHSTKLDRHLGNLSYPLYLVHVPIIAMFQNRVSDGHFGKLAAVAIASLVCVALYILVDRPVDAVRVRLTEYETRTARDKESRRAVKRS